MNMKYVKRCSSIAAAVLALAAWCHAANFVIVPSESTVSFQVKGPIGKVKGKFEKFEGRFSYDPSQPAQWGAMATIDISSIHTGIHKRDSDLQHAEFLDVKSFPAMTFTSTSASQTPSEKPRVHGTLALHGITLPVDLTIESIEATPANSVPQKIHAVATSRIDRKEFGVGLTHGTFMVGRFVDIRLDIQGVLSTAP
jgi:polyisoprenoid-binding protein YceI